MVIEEMPESKDDLKGKFCAQNSVISEIFRNTVSIFLMFKYTELLLFNQGETQFLI